MMRDQSSRKRILRERYQLLLSLAPNVWLAKDRQQKQLVALKRTPRSVLFGLVPRFAEATIRAIEQEPRFLVGHSHEQIPRYVDHFADEDGWYLVQEWVRGISAATYRYQGPAPSESGTGTPPNIAQVLALGIQFCTVLAYLHTRQPPIVHRDVKDANALVTPEGRLVLIDFGISWTQEQESGGPQMLLGTRGYCPPEHYSQDVPTPLEDVYSLGITLGCLLFRDDARDVTQTLADLPSPCRVIPEELRLLLTSMTERVSSHRPSSMAAIAERLRHLFEHVTGLPGTTETLRAVLARPHAGNSPLPTLWEKRRYLFRPATKVHPQPCWVWGTCTNIMRGDGATAVEIEFIHPSKGMTERRWLAPSMLWRLQ